MAKLRKSLRANKKRPVPVPKHSTVKTCLDRIRRGDADAAGVLADWFEENHPGRAATKLRRWVLERLSDEVYWDAADLTKRSFTHWEVRCRVRRRLRNNIKALFGRKWKPLPLKAYIGRKS